MNVGPQGFLIGVLVLVALGVGALAVFLLVRAAWRNRE